MDASAEEPADVLAATIQTEPDVRRAAYVAVDDDLIAEIERRLEAQRPAIEAFFAGPLAEREGPSVLRYRDGGFYRRHRDRGVVESWPDAARRQIAVVVFLNSSGAGAGGFQGGTLDLFFDDAPVVVEPEAGLLVAFAADVPHEVTLVRGGVRDTVVDWFYGEEPGVRS